MRNNSPSSLVTQSGFSLLQSLKNNATPLLLVGFSFAFIGLRLFAQGKKQKALLKKEHKQELIKENKDFDQKGFAKPAHLRRGDKVVTVTLSWGGPEVFPNRYNEGKRRLKDIFGLNVIEARHTRSPHAFLEKNPQVKAKDLMDAFRDPSVKAIFTSIGGENAIKILPYIDFEVIRKNPKIVMGFSDSTVLSFICLKAGLSNFYGPSLMMNFAENVAMSEYEVNSIQKNLFSANPVGEIAQGPGHWTEERVEWGESVSQHKRRQLQKANDDHQGWKFIRGQGQVRGHLLGGCLELLDQLKDSEIWPTQEQWQGSILFVETSEYGWKPEKVGEVLRGLGRKGLFSLISGFLFGRPGGNIPYEEFRKYDETILKVLSEFDCHKLPVITHMDFGHTSPVFVIPMGGNLLIDFDAKKIYLNEPACIVRKDQSSAKEQALFNDCEFRRKLNASLNEKHALLQALKTPETKNQHESKANDSKSLHHGKDIVTRLFHEPSGVNRLLAALSDTQDSTVATMLIERLISYRKNLSPDHHNLLARIAKHAASSGNALIKDLIIQSFDTNDKITSALAAK